MRTTLLTLSMLILWEASPLHAGWTIWQLTDSDVPDVAPDASGAKVVWQTDVGQNSEIMHYDGNSITQLTDNDYRDYRPRVSGANVAWLGEPNDVNEVFLFDSSTTTQLTHGGHSSSDVRVNGNSVVWRSSDSESRHSDVYLYDGTGIVNLTLGMTQK